MEHIETFGHACGWSDDIMHLAILMSILFLFTLISSVHLLLAIN